MVESRKICKFWKTISQSILGGFIPNQKRNVDLDECFPSLHNLYAYRLYMGCQMVMTIQPSHKPTHHQIFKAQEQLGWQQLFYGWQAMEWHIACNLMHPMTNSMHYYTKCLTLIWKAVIQVWTICNKHLHPTDQRLADRTQLQNSVYQIFHNIQKDPNLKDLLTYTNPEHIMTKPTCTIWQWVDNCHSHICNQAKAAAIRAKLHTHHICQYFTWSSGPLPQTAAKNLLRPP